VVSQFDINFKTPENEMKRTNIFISIMICIGMGCSGSGNNGENAQASGSTPAGHLNYTAPAGWVVEQPSSTMRVAQFSLPGQDGMAAAELAVFNIGGSVNANLQRWNGQFSQPDGRPTSEAAQIDKVTVGNLEVTVIYITGTFLASAAMSGGPTSNKPGYAMLAAMVETSQGPWQFKATGPEQTLSYWRESFDEFVRGFTVN